MEQSSLLWQFLMDGLQVKYKTKSFIQVLDTLLSALTTATLTTTDDDVSLEVDGKTG